MIGDPRRSPRTYRTLLWLVLTYVALLVLVAFVPGQRNAENVADPDASVRPSAGTAECVICGIDEACDPATGRCMFVESTPLPCIEGTSFDDRAGFCLPVAQPQPSVDTTGGRQPRTPRQPGTIDDLPGFGNN